MVSASGYTWQMTPTVAAASSRSAAWRASTRVPSMGGASVILSIAVTSVLSVKPVIQLPARTLSPALTVRVFLARVLGTLPNSGQILIRGACASKQLLHPVCRVRHGVADERER